MMVLLCLLSSTKELKASIHLITDSNKGKCRKSNLKGVIIFINDRKIPQSWQIWIFFLSTFPLSFFSILFSLKISLDIYWCLTYNNRVKLTTTKQEQNALLAKKPFWLPTWRLFPGFFLRMELPYCWSFHLLMCSWKMASLPLCRENIWELIMIIRVILSVIGFGKSK